MRAVFILMFLPFLLDAQTRPPIKFGVISMEELKMTSYEKDSSASAVKLFDIGETLVTGIRSSYKRHTRIKILSEDGLRFGDVIVPFFDRGSFFGDLGSFIGLKASTYNLVNGRMEEVKLESKNKYREEFVDGIGVIRFALPQVKVGSVIEYQYELAVKILFELRPWDFQDLIPCKWSEYEAHVSQVAAYQFSFRGYLAPIVNEKKFEFCGGVSATEASSLRIPSEYLEEFRSCEYYHWAMADVPAFKDEPFISSRKNYISGVSFDLTAIDPPGPASPRILMSSWDDLRVKYLEETLSTDEAKKIGNVKKTGFLQKKSEELVKDLNLPDEKVKAIYSYVKNNLEWAGYYSTRIKQEPKEVLEEKKGTSGDLNLVLLSLLRHAGLQADPVLISTRSNGFVRQDVPVRSQFNNVLVLTDYKGKKMLLDATDRYLPMEYLPTSSLNGFGYRATAEGFQWVNLMESPKSKKTVSVEVAVDENGQMKGKLISSSTGYDARAIREKISKQGAKKHMEEFLKGKTIIVQDTSIENLDKLSEPLRETYSIDLTDYSQVAGDVIYIDPILFTKQSSNPFVKEERVYPVDFAYPQETIFILKLTIPPAYTIDELPEPKMSLLPENAGKFVYSTTTADGSITLMSQLVINRALFSHEEYPNLREFYNIVVAKHNEQIVLKRKNP